MGKDVVNERQTVVASNEKNQAKPDKTIQINVENRSQIVGLDDTLNSLIDEILNVDLPGRERDKNQIDSIKESRLNRALNESDTRESNNDSELLNQREDNVLVENLEMVNNVQTNGRKVKCTAERCDKEFGTEVGMKIHFCFKH
ncbi:unnamed protein product [Brachionus calyciflorus]|uniref:C2H2-type domain-containing protein n=1 Tax=Brachionus calyciflorus TaxID=104777 RepID=A0A814IST2_9BILA|nr:unnamed protein product [Brachionus calyciflorus]